MGVNFASLGTQEIAMGLAAGSISAESRVATQATKQLNIARASMRPDRTEVQTFPASLHRAKSCRY